MSNPRRPRYARCDFCGRNAHKVAVRFSTVRPGQHPTLGFCPKCWTDDGQYAPRQKYADALASGAAVIAYDLRRQKVAS